MANGMPHIARNHPRRRSIRRVCRSPTDDRSGCPAPESNSQAMRLRTGIPARRRRPCSLEHRSLADVARDATEAVVEFQNLVCMNGEMSIIEMLVKDEF